MNTALAKVLSNLPLYNDQGQLLAVNGQTLPRPANITDLSFANLQAQLGRFAPVPKAQTNNMDEAYNKTLFAVPYQYATPSASFIQSANTDMALQKALVKLFSNMPLTPLQPQR